MKNKMIFCAVVAAALSLYATEARVESMGSNSEFIKDDISVFVNPATAFEHGNMLVGALGSYSKINDSWVRSDEWFGGWAVYPLASGTKLLLGATLNRPTEVEKELRDLDNDDFFTVHYSELDSTGSAAPWLRRYGITSNPSLFADYLEAVGDISNPAGKIYLFGGAQLDDYAIALGLRYAGSSTNVGKNDLSSISIFGVNVGFTGKMDNHLIEAGINFTNVGIKSKSSLLQMNLDDSYSSFKILLRDYISFSDRLALVPVVTLDKIALLGIDNTDLGIGVGFNRILHQGLTWAGFKYVYHTATLPDVIDGLNRYSALDAWQFKVEETSHSLVFNFGVEKKMLWDFFTLRVGGNKVFEYLEKSSDGIRLSKGLFERDVDAVAWGIALGTPDDKLKFDVTVSEEFPYSNILSGGEGGVLVTRIAAALKF